MFLVEIKLMKFIVPPYNTTFLYIHFICTNMLATLNSCVNPVIYYSRVSKKGSSVKRVVTERIQLNDLCSDRVELCNGVKEGSTRSSIPSDKKALVATVSGQSGG